MRLKSVFIALVILGGAISAALGADGPASCQTDDWFAFRSAVHESQLCKGILAASEGKSDEAVAELEKVIELRPHSEDAYTANSNLLWLYFREGRFRESLVHLKRMLAIKPQDAGANAVLSLLDILGQYPDLEASTAPSFGLHAHIIEGNLFVPLYVNGQPGNYVLDTGVNVSIVSESEARRLGIKVRNSTTQLGDINGLKTGGVRVTEIENVQIGNMHLRHLACIVLPDDNGLFGGLPEGSRGVLSIQVELAMKSFRLDKGGEFAIDVDIPPGTKSVPLAFDKQMPVIEVGFQGKKLNFTFDTGATTTILNPIFAKQFPSVAQKGSHSNYALEGLAGKAKEESSVLPSLTFSLGQPVTLAPATILLKGETLPPYPWAYGNLGFDLLSQRLPFTVDFSHMRVAF
jgi:tetratricopeptide (TPR) repeat protein